MPRRRGRDRRRIAAVVAIVGVAAGGLLAYFLLSSSPSGAATPEAAVQRLLDAGESNDANRARAVLCAGDRALGKLSHPPGSGTITAYTIGNRSVLDRTTVVEATYTTTNSAAPTTEKFPVVKEGGSWKVCFTKALSAIPTTGAGVPSNAFTFPSGDIPSGLGTGGSGSGQVLPTLPSVSGAASLCSGGTSGFGVASTYLGAVALHVLQIADACVYQNEVPESVTLSLAGTLFRPLTTDQNASVIEFESMDGSKKVRITTAKESDGAYYVTAVTVV